MGTPSCDLFLCILMINGLSGELTNIWSSLAQELAKATTDQPYKPTDIRRALDIEQQLISGDRKGCDVVLTAHSGQSRRGRTSLTCSNCKKEGHLSEYCISEGRGMAGKSIEDSRAAQKWDKEAKQEKELKQIKSNSTSNLLVIKDASEKAYIVNLDNNTILNQTSETITKTQDTTNSVGLSSDESNFNLPIDDEEAIEYKGWLAGNDCDTTINWCTHTHYTKSANNVDGNAIEEE